MNATPKWTEVLDAPIEEIASEAVQKQAQNAIACFERRIDLEGSARYCGALLRRRVLQSAAHLLKMILVYALTGYSLNMVGLWGTVMEWGSLSKNGVRKRLQHSQVWLERLVVLMLLCGRLMLPAYPGVRLRLLDASLVCMAGSKKANWRLHLSFDLSAGRMDGVWLTSIQEGESLTRWEFAANEICLADRYYAVPRGIGVLCGASAQFVIRMGWQNLPIQDAHGQAFSIVDWLRVQSPDPAAQPAQTRGWVVTPQGRFPVRLIARAIPFEKAEQKRKAMRAEAKRKHRQVDERSLLAAGFIVLVSNLPGHWSARQILDLYRFRWQIELVFKRLKGLLTFDQIRVVRDPALAQVFLLAKILIALALGEMQWRLAGQDPEAYADPARPVSLWRLTQVLLEAFRQAMIGSLTPQAIQTHWSQLQRYLCDPPRRRPSQFANRPDLGAIYPG